MNKLTPNGNPAYQPIACHVHDQLEHLAVRGVVCLVTYLDDSGQVAETTGRITDIENRGGEEYLSLDRELDIRLDRIEGFEEL